MLNIFATIQVLLLTVLCMWSNHARATSVTEFTFTDLVAQADVIAVGTVTEIREQWDEEKKSPLTLVTFSNLTVAKGSPGSSFTLEFLGGKMPNGLVMTIPGFLNLPSVKKPWCSVLAIVGISVRSSVSGRGSSGL